MNIHFDNAVDAICRASAILYAIDEIFMEEADSRLKSNDFSLNLLYQPVKTTIFAFAIISYRLRK